MEGELGKEVDSLAQRFNAENPDYKIVPTYKGNYEQNLARDCRISYRQRAGYFAGL
ncbi:glycerol-3-phosphate ABC transporter, substrate-binding protein [Escherichia coli]|nr:glycerol-3-phosphate ABC transporter, substrate-binding protein [Escherichia coli]